MSWYQTGRTAHITYLNENDASKLHELSKQLNKIDEEYNQLRTKIKDQIIKRWNLTEENFPDIEIFEDRAVLTYIPSKSKSIRNPKLKTKKRKGTK